MAKQSRLKFTADFKTQVVLDALKERNTMEELSKKYEVHPTQINTWKREYLGKAASLFSNMNEQENKQNEADTEKLYAQIGHLKVENCII